MVRTNKLRLNPFEDATPRMCTPDPKKVNAITAATSHARAPALEALHFNGDRIVTKSTAMGKVASKTLAKCRSWPPVFNGLVLRYKKLIPFLIAIRENCIK